MKTPKTSPNVISFLVGAVAVCAVIFLAYHGLKSMSCESSTLVGTLQPLAVPDQRRAGAIQQFVSDAVETAQNFQGTKEELFRQLTEARGDEGAYLIGYQTVSDNQAAKGTLVLHGVPTHKWCDARHPLCDAKGPSLVGKDLYNFETLGGVYEVRLWIDIAARGGGWAAAFWKDPEGNIKPKYYYIKGVPGKDFLLASGYFM